MKYNEKKVKSIPDCEVELKICFDSVPQVGSTFCISSRSSLILILIYRTLSCSV